MRAWQTEKQIQSVFALVARADMHEDTENEREKAANRSRGIRLP